MYLITGLIPVTGISIFQAESNLLKTEARTRGKIDYLGKIQTTTKLYPYGAGYGNRTRFCSLGRNHSTSELIPPGEPSNAKLKL
jgi:hypothetical protein